MSTENSISSTWHVDLWVLHSCSALQLLSLCTYVRSDGVGEPCTHQISDQWYELPRECDLSIQTQWSYQVFCIWLLMMMMFRLHAQEACILPASSEEVVNWPHYCCCQSSTQWLHQCYCTVQSAPDWHSQVPRSWYPATESKQYWRQWTPQQQGSARHPYPQQPQWRTCTHNRQHTSTTDYHMIVYGIADVCVLCVWATFSGKRHLKANKPTAHQSPSYPSHSMDSTSHCSNGLHLGH